MMHAQRTSPRSEYLQQENLRVLESASLATKFSALKSLTVELGHFDPEGRSRHSQIKYTVNLDHAKSVFRVACHNHECVRGDFDLSEVLAEAAAARRKVVTGEMCCQGWRSKTAIETLRCHNILRYTMTLGY
jgi:hypothetical protein